MPESLNNPTGRTKHVHDYRLGNQSGEATEDMKDKVLLLRITKWCDDFESN